jgi:hypothetical protein
MSARNRLEWAGLVDLKNMLRAMPAALTADASKIVLSTANEAARRIGDLYPSRTDHARLREGLVVEVQDAGRFGAGVRVRNRAPLAEIFEYGTQARHTKLGASRGSMPAGNVFVPTMIAYRARMYDQLSAMLEAHGLRVRGRSGGMALAA